MVSEAKKKEIQKEAKEILDRFASSLKSVKFKEKALKKEVGGFRKEVGGEKCDPDFRKAMFENAPNVDGDCIVAEKKKW